MNLIEFIFRRKELRKLREKVREYESGDLFVLSSGERIFILDALRDPHYIQKVQAPPTRYLIRQIYKKLVLKIAKKEVEMDTDFVKNIKGQR